MKVSSTTTLSFPTLSPLLTAGKNIVGYFLDRWWTWFCHLVFHILAFHYCQESKICINISDLKSVLSYIMLPNGLDVNVFEVPVHSSEMLINIYRVNSVTSLKTVIFIVTYVTFSCINGCWRTYAIDVASLNIQWSNQEDVCLYDIPTILYSLLTGILLASGIPHHQAVNAIRLSVGRETTTDDIDIAIKDLKQSVAALLYKNSS
jgi:hypothetical protein